MLYKSFMLMILINEILIFLLKKKKKVRGKYYRTNTKSTKY
jgi:hypothetical protein